MADDRGDASAAAGDVLEMQGQGVVTAEVGGVHGGAGKLATAAYVAGSASSLQKVMVSSGVVHPDAPVAPPAMEEQVFALGTHLHLLSLYICLWEDVDVDRDNFASFKEKEEEKIRIKGMDEYYKSKTKTWRCPYYTTKPKPKSGRFVHLLAHAEDVDIHGEDYKIMGQHAALAKVLSAPFPDVKML
ncbi:hypothetical protein VPH35_030673 [Triticum aestivum]